MTTTDRNLVNQSDAIILHPFDVNIKDLPMHRTAHQRYILFFYEAYVYTKLWNWEKLQNKSVNLLHLRGKLAADDSALLQNV